MYADNYDVSKVVNATFHHARAIGGTTLTLAGVLVPNRSDRQLNIDN